MHSEGQGRDGRCLVGSTLKLRGLGRCRADKGWVVKSDDSGRREEGKELKATSVALTPCRIKRWSLMTGASSITKLINTDVAKNSRGPLPSESWLHIPGADGKGTVASLCPPKALLSILLRGQSIPMLLHFQL